MTLPNYVSLSPVSFLRRAAGAFGEKAAVLHGNREVTYGELYARCRRLASALSRRGVKQGDTVSILAPNVPSMLEAQYAVPMLGAVLNSINIRLDPDAVGFILEHGQAKALIVDGELAGTAKRALDRSGVRPLVVDAPDPEAQGTETVGEIAYEDFLAGGDPDFDWRLPEDERQPILLNYTSGTTGNPKGVLGTHRGAYLNALGNAVTFGLSERTRYLWTLPMFHCNGWCYTWAVTAVGGTHVCLRKVDPALIFQRIQEHGVTHMCGAPIVLGMLIRAPEEDRRTFPQRVRFATGGAGLPPSLIRDAEALGFDLLHLYGLTETYGPSLQCAWQEDWEDISFDERAARMARQGIPLVTMDQVEVVDPETGLPVPSDGATIGEIVHRGNTVMLEYLKNGPATEETFSGGWHHTGDLAVRHPDGYIEIKDRAKDIIISGGENIASLEIEEVLLRHPQVVAAAVVAKAHETWGETPCAFITPADGVELAADEIIEHCRKRLARFKVPRHVVFGELPKTSTGKVQKFLLRERAREIG